MDIDLEAVKLGESLGLGGLLAATMFFFYRRDAKQAREQLDTIIKDYRTLLEKVLGHLEAHHEK